MLNRLEAVDCNLDLMWRLDQDRGARNSGRARRRVLKGKGRRRGSSWDIWNKWGSEPTDKKTETGQKGRDPQVADTDGNQRPEAQCRDGPWGVNKHREPCTERQPPKVVTTGKWRRRTDIK